MSIPPADPSSPPPPGAGATDAHPRPAVTVDLVIFTVWDTDLKVLLIERGEPPFQGCWALPGGFVRVGTRPEDWGESLVDAAHRELEEETGLPRGSAWLEQLYTYGAPDRDPRTRVISVAWTALIRPDLAPLVTAGSDAAAARWTSLTELPSLAFDHQSMVARGLERLRERIETTSVAFELVPPTFTVSELRQVFEAILGSRTDRGNFRRRFNRLLEDGVIEQAPGKRQTTKRPARVYRFLRSQPSP